MTAMEVEQVFAIFWTSLPPFSLPNKTFGPTKHTWLGISHVHAHGRKDRW
ncbi:hypothetical protein MANES_18G034250v8 [Manihot esculenta]|uniref:Uncharacterized protein n=1 Tax=Manihot esculenta TaxID=3983 RepID=A0ACB7FYL3_MANES|nr:hypothetical protein MANES_18G034250v8 [Manihot esculenta]